ncbi:hypothetical protein [Frankia sp. R82]|uniref:hypothetical protein n=1 Tax=Frankia sp. R82 TaxID=2950553 RepID=UPI0020444DE1|nr:hypothetical protein [Frankia sp. R82]MCM3883065.1 hypothetical protein [Frankia sp. R82]
MTAPTSTSSSESNICPEFRVGLDASARLVTVIVGVVVALTFLFGFGNSFALGVRLGVPIWVAPLVAPAVDLSVVALLLGTRYLSVHDGPAEVLRAARRLLLFASLVTLSLNIAEPLIAGHYGRAAFDAVGPLLLIGWGEVAPDLLQAMQTTDMDASRPGSPASFTPSDPAEQDQPAPSLSRPGRPETRTREARDQDLLHRARAEDVLHWQTHQRPISAETLRKRLHVGTGTARELVARVRDDTHATLHDRATRRSSTQP